MSRAKTILPGLLLAGLLAGCGVGNSSPDPLNPEHRVNPLSKVSVYNTADDFRYVRLNWPIGPAQMFRVEPGVPQLLSGAIGSSGFPRSIDVLDPECEVLASVQGLGAGRAGLLSISPAEVRLDQIIFADRSWAVSDGSVYECGATED